MSDEHESLIERARRGDRAALDALLQSYQGRIFRFGMRMCRDPEDAKDVTQDTLVALAKGIADFRGASSLSTWLFTVARSYCIKKRRRRAQQPSEVVPFSHELDARTASDARAPDDNAADRELDRALGDAIDALEPSYREVLLLRDVEGMSAAEVAEVLGVSVEAVKSRLHRARVSVREALAPLVAPESERAEKAPGTCPDVLAVLSHKIDGDIDVAQCAEMERHIAACPRCRGACDSLKRTLAVCRAAPAGDVPADVQAAVRDAVRALERTRGSAR